MMRRLFQLLTLALLALIAAAALYWGRAALKGIETVEALLFENKELRTAITNLTAEERIGYAKVLEQKRNPAGVLETLIRFVVVDPRDGSTPLLEKEYLIEGDVIHFDALIVRFEAPLVQRGEERALYIWRRIYGENMAPRDGFPIEVHGSIPQRYQYWLGDLRPAYRELFWQGIWDLTSNPERLSEHGVNVIYGNAVYTRLRPGFIYAFKLSATGQVYPEIIPDLGR